MLFFGSRCERLCMMQFSLISLIPGLIGNLQDCADPELDNYEKKLTRPTSLKTSDRNSMLSYMGLPLQIFGKVDIPNAFTLNRARANIWLSRAACSGRIRPCNS
jgi:hypothetical protein